MSTQGFYDAGKKALLEARQKREAKIEAEWQFAKDNMLNAITVLYGENLAEMLREHGVTASVSGTKAIVYGEFAFAPYGNSGWCNNSPTFKFAVVKLDGENYETWTGFTTVDKVEDLTKHVDSTREQIERQEAAERELAAAPKSNWNADFIQRIATRIRNGQTHQADNVVLQFAIFIHGYGEDYRGTYDDGDNDGDNE